MKRGYENFLILTKISLVLFITAMFCGRVYALPQDWPCAPVEVVKIGVISDIGDDFEYSYRGETEKYVLEINLSGSHRFPDLFANCGTAGCWGKMINLETGQSETMRFDCVFGKDKDVVNCSRIAGNEYILTKFSDNEYRVELCGDFYQYIYLDKCRRCKCLLQDSRENKGSSNYVMNCTSENEKQIHCYTEEAYNWAHKYENEIDDFENCVGLNL